MKQVFFLAIIFALFITPCLSQTKEAQKFDEFGLTPYGAASARMDNLASALINEPDVKAYIIVYAGKDDYPGISHRYAQRLRVYLAVRGIDIKRITALGAGRQKEQRTEIWLVPNGAKPPTPTAIFAAEEIPKNQLIKFDEYPFDLINDDDMDMWEGRYESEYARLGRIAELLKNRSDLRLYIVARAQAVYVYKSIGRKLKDDKRKYIQVRNRKLSDPLGTDKKIANEEKRHLISEFGIKASRIIAVGNGYQRSPKSEPEIMSSDNSTGLYYTGRTVQLWLVPGNEPDSILNKILIP